jgi:hypothetical protein
MLKKKEVKEVLRRGESAKHLTIGSKVTAAFIIIYRV